MRQCVTIAGDSSVGKKTLITRLLGDAALRERLDLAGSVEAFGYSFRPLEHAFASLVDVALIQWQWVSDHVTQELSRRGSRMADRHRVLLLWRPWLDHLEALNRCHGRAVTPAWLQEEWSYHLLPRFESLARFGWQVDVLESSTYFRLGSIR